jgi:ribosomal protein S18 acetylase RimI-like enzyme
VSDLSTRPAVPADYDAIAAVVDEWWGRSIVGKLPRLFLDHFHDTSFVIEYPAMPRPATPRPVLAAFLVGFMSAAQPQDAYIHFVGVRPDLRTSGLGRQLYEDFFALARDAGRTVVSAITGPVNERSIAFHRRMGFDVRGPVADYDGPGTSLMVFRREL